MDSSSFYPPSPPSPPTDLVIQFYNEYIRTEPALAAMVLYILIAIVSLTLTVRTRTWFTIIVPITAAFETAGYGLRYGIIKGPASYNMYIGTQCFLIISPVLLAIVDYIALGRLLALSEKGREWWATKWIARAFTASDILCLILQGGGAAIMVKQDASEQSKKMGHDNLVAGLILQLGFLSCFMALTLYIQKTPSFELGSQKRLRPVFWCLYLTIPLMFIRNVFRSAEFIQGYKGTLASHEFYFYIFDFALIYSVCLLFCILHYGFYLGPARKGSVGPLCCGDSAAADLEQGLASDKDSNNISTGAVPVKESQSEASQQQVDAEVHLSARADAGAAAAAAEGKPKNVSSGGDSVKAWDPSDVTESHAQMQYLQLEGGRRQ